MLLFALATAVAAPTLPSTLHAGEDPRTLVVLLPGIFASHDTLERRGVVDALRRGGLRSDVLAVDVNLAMYRDRTVSQVLADEVLRPANDRYEHVWVMGISLGGLGGLLALRDAPELVDGLVLLSPWLGRPSKVSEVRDAGGLRTWTAPEDGPWEVSMWSWLQDQAVNGWSAPVHLGFGHADLAVTNHRTLAGAMDEDAVWRVRGGHSWSTWRDLAYRITSEHLMALPPFKAEVAAVSDAGGAVEEDGVGR